MSTPRIIFIAAVLIVAVLLIWHLNRGPNTVALSRVGASETPKARVTPISPSVLSVAFKEKNTSPDGLALLRDGAIVIAALQAGAMGRAHARPAFPTRRDAAAGGAAGRHAAAVGVGWRFPMGAIDNSVGRGPRSVAAAGEAGGSDDVLLQVHGSGGNFASLPLRATARALSARGFAALSISTRQHDEHVNTDNFFEVRRDIEAAVLTAKALGYGALVLQGHSLGTAQVAFYAATDWDPAIRGVILTGAIAKLPWKARHILIQDEDAYRALAQAARDAVRARRPEATLPMPMSWIGGPPGDGAAFSDLPRRSRERRRHDLLDRAHPAPGCPAGARCSRRRRAAVRALHATERGARRGFARPRDPLRAAAQPPPAEPRGTHLCRQHRPLAKAIASWLAERGL